MKRYLYFTLAFALTACGAKEQTESNAAEKRTIEIQPFLSPDRAYADLRGDAVESVTVSCEMEQSADTLRVAAESLTTTLTERFDAAGHITEVVREDSFLEQSVGRSVFSFEFDDKGELVNSSTDLDGRFAVKRDKEGYVVSFASINNTGDKDYTKQYTWADGRLASQRIANDHQPVDADGNPIPMPADKITFAYSEQGYLVSEHEESGDPQLQMSIIDTAYDYTDYDSVGNWTARNVTRTARVYEIRGGKRSLVDSVSTYQSDLRNISYR